MRTLLAITFAALLTLTACGSDDGTDPEASDDSTSAAGADPAQSAVAADDEDEGGADTESSASPTDPDFDSEPFCAAMSELDAALDLQPPLLDPSRSPDEVEELVVDVETKFDTVVETAPPDLQSDWIVVSDAFKSMTELIRDADFDVSAVDQAEILEVGDDEEAFAAGDRLPSEEEFCGS